MNPQYKASLTAKVMNAFRHQLGGFPKIRPSILMRGLVLALILAATGVAVKPASALTRDLVTADLRSTVQVIVPDNNNEIFSLGSGTVMNDTGLILTNNHVVAGDASNGLMNDQAMAVIAVPPADMRGDAVMKYVGVVVKHDDKVDLALIQITGLVDDPNKPLPANLGLPPIARGNSDDLMIGDPINIFGFPGLGGNSPTYTKGAVSGFSDDDHDGVYEWIKTDAELNHGNSGGLATDDTGAFVGVPSAGNTDDIGKIGLVRTGNLALDFVNSYFPSPQGDGPQVSNVKFAEAINRSGAAVKPATQFDSGTTDLYATFDFKGFEDKADFTYVWYSKGQEILRDGFAWDSGVSGSNWVSVNDDKGLADGYTELEILYNGKSLYRGGVTVGNKSATPPVNSSTASFSNVVFASGVDSNNQPQGVNTSFSNVDNIYAFFDYKGMTNGVDWVSRWYYNDQKVVETPATWDAGANGTTWVSVSHDSGLPAGKYDLELEVQGEIFQKASFTIQNAGSNNNSNNSNNNSNNSNNNNGNNKNPKQVGVTGEVSDRNNSRTKISGAFIVFLKSGNTVSQWVDAKFDDSMILGTATSNDDGTFVLSSKVTPGESYSVVVVHDDYQPVSADGFQIPADTDDPYQLAVTMDHK